MGDFRLTSEYTPRGDQQQAIDKLTEGIKNGEKGQVLLGVTGSGKTFTIANVIQNVNKPTLVLAHNKTLAAQLCTEFKAFFPEIPLMVDAAGCAGVTPESHLNALNAMKAIQVQIVNE